MAPACFSLADYASLIRYGLGGMVRVAGDDDTGKAGGGVGLNFLKL